MERDHATQSLNCPSCSAPIEIAQTWTPGGINDYGGFVLQCGSCKHVFAFRMGRDINDSSVASGAKALGTWDEAVPGDREDVMKQHGLTP